MTTKRITTDRINNKDLRIDTYTNSARFVMGILHIPSGLYLMEHQDGAYSWYHLRDGIVESMLEHPKFLMWEKSQ